jgi:hypothetical protein
MSVKAINKIIVEVLDGGPLTCQRKFEVASCAPVAIPAVGH